MLQSMRFRDIGWDPVCVIPGWIALVIMDQVIATKFPAVSLGHDHPGTIVGALTNLGLVLALTFWPSSRHEHWTPRFDMPPEPPDAAPRRQDAALRPPHAWHGWPAENSAADIAHSRQIRYSAPSMM